MTLTNTIHTPTPWPAEGAVLMQVPGDSDASRRTANYLRARDCVEACQPFAAPGDALRVLVRAACAAAPALADRELQRDLARVLAEYRAHHDALLAEPVGE